MLNQFNFYTTQGDGRNCKARLSAICNRSSVDGELNFKFCKLFKASDLLNQTREHKHTAFFKLSLDGNRKCPVLLFHTLHTATFIQCLFIRKNDQYENLGEATVLACEMFTFGCRPRLKNSTSSSSLLSLSSARDKPVCKIHVRHSQGASAVAVVSNFGRPPSVACTTDLVGARVFEPLSFLSLKLRD